VSDMLKFTKVCQGLLKSASCLNTACAHPPVLEAACPQVCRPGSLIVEDCVKRFEPKWLRNELTRQKQRYTELCFDNKPALCLEVPVVVTLDNEEVLVVLLSAKLTP